MDQSAAVDLVKALEAFEELSSLSSINNTFLPAFKEAVFKGDGARYLKGNFTLGKVVSGRLSSSDVNLTNLPSGGNKYAGAVKKLFKAPNGWVMCGADYNALEDMISALTTKDPNKIKIYTEGYDGHCLRAHAYFPDILGHLSVTPEAINSIAKDFPKERRDSKPCTFLLTYKGTKYGLERNLGFSERMSASIEKNYHTLYKVSDDWVDDKIKIASSVGYVTGAFGLKLRTPVLHRTILGNKYTPSIAKAEERTAGNMLGQSYGLLTTRALNAFMELVWNSKYKYDIKPIASIHDALYFIIRDNINVVEWVNDNLIKCMQWQELPEIQHDIVKLGASLELYPNGWHDPIILPNFADSATIMSTVKHHKKEE